MVKGSKQKVPTVRLCDEGCECWSWNVERVGIFHLVTSRPRGTSGSVSSVRTLNAPTTLAQPVGAVFDRKSNHSNGGVDIRLSSDPCSFSGAVGYAHHRSASHAGPT